MRGLAAALIALLVGRGSTHAADPLSFHINLLTTWLESVRAHEPGREDLAAQTIAEWSNRELKTLWLDVQMLVRLVRCRSCGETKVPELGSPTTADRGGTRVGPRSDLGPTSRRFERNG